MNCSASRVLLFAALLSVSIVLSRAARADSLDGKWSMSPMSEAYTVKQWVGGCGPAPVNGNAGGGGTVKIVTEGDELTMIGGRVFRTNQCWDPLPTLVRDSHSRDPSGKRWSTRCSTPPGDPRRAVVTTQVVATSDTQIQIIETGRYEIHLAEGTCIADVRRASSLNLIERAGSAPAPSATATATPSATTTAPAPAPATAPAPAPATATDCSSPGDPARLEVRPSRKILRTGETFTFKATVYDDKGCATQTPTIWKNLAPKMDTGRPSVGSDGVVKIDDATPEMTFDIEVTAAGKSTKVTVEVTSPANYDELLSRSGLNAQGESDRPSVVLIATSSIGGGDSRSEDGAKKRQLLFIGITVALVGLIGIVAVIGVRRSRKAAQLEREAEERHEERLREYETRKRQKEAAHAAQMQAHLESVKRAQEAAAAATAAQREAMGPMVCPSCRQEFPPGSAFCPNDANRLIPIRGHEDVLAGPSGLLCPLCRRGYNPGIKVCPADGEALVPQPMMTNDPIAAAKGKICPTCGDRFDGAAGFCGKDGTALVLLN